MNTLNQTFYSRLSARNDILLTQTVLNGVFCIRFVVGSERTTVDDIHRAADILVQEAKGVIEDWKVKNASNLNQSGRRKELETTKATL